MLDVVQKCRITGESFKITESDQAFFKMMQVPFPTVCPKERLRRRLCERNTHSLYWRTCDFSGNKILSQYHENVPFPVYEAPIWWGDEWDPMDYGVDFDFNRPFFDQFFELKNKVPHMALYVIYDTMENCEFVNCAGYIRNCYLVAEMDYSESCYYTNRVYHSKDIVDCSNLYSCELCYECYDLENCQRLLYSQDCQQCHDSYFLKDCVGLKDCIGCINQRQKKYMIFNKQYSKEDYEKHKTIFRLDMHSGIQKLKQQCEDFFKTQPHKALEEEQNENSLGDHLYNSKNSFYCFDAKDLEDCKYCARTAGGVKVAMDYTAWGFGAERVYQVAACGDNIFNLKFCSSNTTNLSDVEYGMLCTSSSNLFGCVGLKKKKYCILNKQYTPEEYEQLKNKIIAHMKETEEYGEFFPNGSAHFAYNESLAMDVFPISKEEVLKLGYYWRDEEEKKEYKAATIELSDSINDINESITKEILVCEKTGKNYKIVPQEYAFYKKLGIPIARRAPTVRHSDRQAIRNPYVIYDRKCDKCQKDIQSTYSLERPEKVCCEECYLKEVY